MEALDECGLGEGEERRSSERKKGSSESDDDASDENDEEQGWSKNKMNKEEQSGIVYARHRKAKRISRSRRGVVAIILNATTTITGKQRGGKRRHSLHEDSKRSGSQVMQGFGFIEVEISKQR